MKKLLLLLPLFLLLMTACNDAAEIAKEMRRTSVTLNNENQSTGKTAELLLVMDKTWPEEVQDTVYLILAKPMTGLPQPEPMFSIYQTEPSLFKGDYTRRANIIYLDVNENFTEPNCKIERNPWSKPQVYAHIMAATRDEAIGMLAEKCDEILQEMYANDIAKLQMNQAKTPNIELQNYVKEKFGILMTIPQEYAIAREGDGFLWLAYRTKKNDRFVMIYTSENKSMTRAMLIAKRNYITQKYIEGETKEVYPRVVEQMGLPTYQPLTLWNKSGAQLRGLWETEKDYMGGPFYQFSFINTNGECVTIDGFVFAPEEPKAVYMRQVEAIVKSVK